MSERAEPYRKPESVVIERMITFYLVGTEWHFSTWHDFVPVNTKVFKLKIEVPAELIGGEVIAEVQPVSVNKNER